MINNANVTHSIKQIHIINGRWLGVIQNWHQPVFRHFHALSTAINWPSPPPACGNSQPSIAHMYKSYLTNWYSQNYVYTGIKRQLKYLNCRKIFIYNINEVTLSYKYWIIYSLINIKVQFVLELLNYWTIGVPTLGHIWLPMPRLLYTHFLTKGGCTRASADLTFVISSLRIYP